MRLNEFHRRNWDRMHEAFAPPHSLSALMICVQEEVGEIAAAVLGVTGEKKRKEHLTYADVLKETADAITYLSLLARSAGCEDLEKLLAERFDKVSDRAGSSVKVAKPRRHPDLELDVPEPPLKAVYIAHPLGADRATRESNRAAAAKWVAWAGDQDVCPMASWIILSGEWPESDEYRAKGLSLDFAQILRCDEVWLCGPRVSAGMVLERKFAEAQGIPVRDLTAVSGRRLKSRLL